MSDLVKRLYRGPVWLDRDDVDRIIPECQVDAGKTSALMSEAADYIEQLESQLANARKDDSELADRLEKLLEKATPGPWELWTSNSFRRITGPDQSDGGVLYGYANPNDGHGELGGYNVDNDLALAIELVNNAPAIIAALRKP